jgi:hypothetical protein
MVRQVLTSFSPANRQTLFLLFANHLLWSALLIALWILGRLFGSSFWLSSLFLLLQLYAAAQIVLPALLLNPEQRTRRFYFFWAMILGGSIWLINQLPPFYQWQPLLDAVKSGLLLLVATLIGAVLARYVTRLWEIVPVCIVMTLADLASWLFGPTANFTEEIQQYYQAPDGAPPFVDMLLVKLAFPGQIGLAPVFGVSDWIMVVFFVMVAGRFGVNDNLIGVAGESLARREKVFRYLPVSVVALFVAILLAQSSGLFIPGLPLIAVIMLLWYAGRYLFVQRRD